MKIRNPRTKDGSRLSPFRLERSVTMVGPTSTARPSCRLWATDVLGDASHFSLSGHAMLLRKLPLRGIACAVDGQQNH